MKTAIPRWKAIAASRIGVRNLSLSSSGGSAACNTDPDKPNGWMVTPDDQASLAAALVEAVSSESERVRRGQNGRALIEREYDWKRIAARVDAVYREVIAEATQF